METIDDEIVIIELNMSDDFASASAYYVDYQWRTLPINIQYAEDGHNSDRWIIIGLAMGMEEGLEKARKLRQYLCKKHNREMRD